MKPDISDKNEMIIDAAIRRFSYFGVGKTTMTEIADDVALTKQALAHYFTDKQSLIIAVINQIITRYLDEVSAKCHAAATVEEGLLQLTEIKKSFFERYFMLFMQNRNVDLKIDSPEIQKTRTRVQQKEIEIISALLERGMQAGEIRNVHAGKTSVLILNTLFAFECMLKMEKVLPEEEDFLAVNKRQKEVLHLLIHGLKNNSAA